MRKTGKLAGVLLVAGALAASVAATAFSARQLPLGSMLLTGAIFIENPAVGLSLLENSTLAVRGSWNGGNKGDKPRPTATPSPAPSASPAPTASPTAPGATATPQPTALPGTAELTPAGMGTIEAQTLPQGQGNGYVSLAAGSIKNATDNSDAELAEAAKGDLPFSVEVNSAEPQVLILHTHATETYQPWTGLYYDPSFTARTEDTSQNMCAVGKKMAEVLNAAGINTLHDETLHDSPSYTESYARSAETAKAYLAKYPSIKIILDVHRDAIERDNTRIKPVAEIEGEETAQVMLICGCNNGDTIRLPEWRQNLKFAARWEAQMESLYPGLTRPVLCGYRFYNQDLSTGSLLIEVGGHANTLEEARRAGDYAARALAALLTAK